MVRGPGVRDDGGDDTDLSVRDDAGDIIKKVSALVFGHFGQVHAMSGQPR